MRLFSRFAAAQWHLRMLAILCSLLDTAFLEWVSEDAVRSRLGSRLTRSRAHSQRMTLLYFILKYTLCVLLGQFSNHIIAHNEQFST